MRLHHDGFMGKLLSCPMIWPREKAAPRTRSSRSTSTWHRSLANRVLAMPGRVRPASCLHAPAAACLVLESLARAAGRASLVTLAKNGWRTRASAPKRASGSRRTADRYRPTSRTATTTRSSRPLGTIASSVIARVRVHDLLRRGGDQFTWPARKSLSARPSCMRLAGKGGKPRLAASS